MRALIACEESGKVADRIDAIPGWSAMSADLMPSRTREFPEHWAGDVLDVLSAPWDLLIAFPPCTDLAVSGARWFPAKIADGRQDAAERFVRILYSAKHIPHTAIENPVGVLSTRWRKPDQIIHPWQFGHGEVKQTCLWLRGLPLLRPTNVVPGREARVHKMGRRPDRAQLRSETYDGIAQAMAEQWTAAAMLGSQAVLF